MSHSAVSHLHFTKGEVENKPSPDKNKFSEIKSIIILSTTNT